MVDLSGKIKKYEMDYMKRKLMRKSYEIFEKFPDIAVQNL